MSIVATTEDAIIAQLQSVLSNHVRSIEALSGPWTMAALKRALQFAPCVRVAFLGGNASDAEDAAIDARFGVYLIAGHATDKQRRRGTPNVMGIYDMLELAVPALNEFNISGVGSLFLKSVAQTFTEQTLQLGGAVYSAIFSIPNLVLPPIDPTAAMADFITFHADSQLDTDPEPELITEEDNLNV